MQIFDLPKVGEHVLDVVFRGLFMYIGYKDDPSFDRWYENALVV